MTEKTINFRSFLVIAVFVLVAVFAALLSVVVPWAGTIVFALLLGDAIFLCVRHSKKEKYKLITFILCAVMMTIAYFSFIFTEANWSGGEYGYMRISGVVQSDREADGQRRIYLTNAVVSDRQFKGKIALYIEDSDNTLDSGMFIALTAKVSAVKLVEGGKVNAWAFRNNIKYTAYAKNINAEMIKGYEKPGFFIRAREFIHQKLTSVMGAEYGALAYGMVTGDKDFIDFEVKNYFSAAGLSHILAVSGLHLGFVAAILTWILKKCRAGRKANACAVSFFLLLYVLLAGASPSILRAAVMSLLGVYVYLFGNRKDALSSLCAAFCVIVAAAPFFMFEAGFVLSVSCVYGITLFYLPIHKALRKIKAPKPIAAALATGVAVQIGMLPAAVFFFEYLNVYSLIVNVLLMPVITVTFTAIFVCLIIAVILPFRFFSLPLAVSGIGLTVIDTVAGVFASLPLSRIILYLTPAVFVCCALYFCMSRFVMLKRKRPVILLCILLCIMLFFMQSYPKADTASVVPLDYAYDSMTLITTDGGNYLVGNISSGAMAQKKLRELKIRKLDAVFINGMNRRTAQELLRLSAFFEDFTVYFPFGANAGEETLDGIMMLENKLILADFDGEDELAGGFYSVYNGDSFYGYSFYENEISVLFTPYGTNYAEFQWISEYDVIRASSCHTADGGQILLLNSFVPAPAEEPDSEDESEENTEKKPEEENPPVDYSLIFSFDLYPDYAFNYRKGIVYKTQ